VRAIPRWGARYTEERGVVGGTVCALSVARGGFIFGHIERHMFPVGHHITHGGWQRTKLMAMPRASAYMVPSPALKGLTREIIPHVTPSMNAQSRGVLFTRTRPVFARLTVRLRRVLANLANAQEWVLPPNHT